MTITAILIIIAVCLPGLSIAWDFLHFLLMGERFFQKQMQWVLAFIQMLYPALYLVADWGVRNDCCTDSAFFSPEHRLSIYVLIGLCIGAYFYSLFKKSVAPPLIEVILNCLLLVGIVLNVLVAIHVREWYFWMIGNVPVIFLFLFALVRNHALLGEALEGDHFPEEGQGRLQLFCRRILLLKPLYKIPILFIVCLPLLIVLAGILLLFGQKQDSLIRAFTDTYHHGLSQWDYQCEGVVCGGHFLCTIAAQGHGAVVRPIRSGVRAGRNITCNRQLLISNAFEELLEQKWPALHRPVRRLYNRIGDQIHRHYGLFRHKWVSDLVYVIMKPLEWIFLLVLYCSDRKPENRIAQQYMSAADRKEIRRGIPA